MKLESGQARIGIIGLGYVGLPLALAYCDNGYSVTGVDISEHRTQLLLDGRSGISHIPDGDVSKIVQNGQFKVTTDFSALSDATAILICVPTPLDRNKEPDLTYIEGTAKSIAAHLTEGQIIVLESTTYPGTTDEVLVPLLEEGSELTLNEDFFVAYSPERLNPGDPKHTISTTPKVVGANNSTALQMVTALYEALVSEVVPVSSTRVAEAVKLTENIFRSVNIALMNELKLVFDAMDIDIWEVVEAAKTKPFGYMPFYPGPGLGGHCIPIDPFYLAWKARESGITTRFIELAGEINTKMPTHVIFTLIAELDQRFRKSIFDARVLLIGMAYKKNTSDIRESPSLELLDILLKKGARVDYYDPHVPIISSTRQYGNLAGRQSIEWVSAICETYDAVLISTDHDDIDWHTLAENSPLLIDTRNVLKDLPEGLQCRVAKA